jgi:flagellar assembly protein FliH
LSNRYDSKVEGAAEIREYELQSFTEESAAPPDQPRLEYQFTPFGEETEDPAECLERAQAEAERIVSEARSRAEAEADRIRSEADAEADRLRKEAKKIREEASEKGHAQGYQKGLARGEAEWKEKFNQEMAPLLTSLSQVDQLYENLWAANEPVMVELALTVARSVIMDEINTSDQALRGAFRAALDQLQEQHQAAFRVNPDDLEQLAHIRDQLKDQLSGMTKITLEPDANLSRGDLVMETDSGRLNATLKQRLDAVVGAVDAALRQRFDDLDW